MNRYSMDNNDNTNDEEGIDNSTDLGIHSQFTSLGNSIEEIIDDNQEFPDQLSIVKELGLVMNGFQIPYATKGIINEFTAIVLSLHSKKKLEAFITLLQKTKVKCHLMLSIIITSLQAFLNIISHTKGEGVSLHMIKYIIGNSLYFLNEKTISNIVRFLSIKSAVEPKYIDDIIAMVEKNKNIYTVYICGLAMMIKPTEANKEQRKRLCKIFCAYVEDKVLDDENREANLINERLLVQFLTNAEDDLFYEVIISRCVMMLVRSRKNSDFVMVMFEGLKGKAYRKEFLMGMFEQFNQFFFPNEYSDYPHKSFSAIIEGNMEHCRDLLGKLMEMTFDSDKTCAYLNVINYIIAIFEEKNDKSGNCSKWDKKILFKAIGYVIRNISKAESLKEKYDEILERLIDAAICNEFNGNTIENIENNSIEEYNTAIDDLLANGDISNSHCYIFTLITIIMRKYAIYPQGSTIGTIEAYIKKNMSIDQINEDNKRNMLPLAACVLTLQRSINNTSNKTMISFTSETLDLISQSAYLLKSFNDLNRFDSMSLYIILSAYITTKEINEDFLSKYLRIISRILFKSTYSTSELTILSSLYTQIFSLETPSIARQLLDFIFLHVFNIQSDFKHQPPISFNRITTYLNHYMEHHFTSVQSKEFIKLLVLLHIPNMYLNTSKRSMPKNKFLERFYSPQYPHRDAFIGKIESSIEDIAYFLFSDLGLFNQSNQIVVNCCYVIIGKVFQWTKVGEVLLKNSFGKLTLKKFAYIERLIAFYQKELDYFNKFELVELIEDLKRLEREYVASYSFIAEETKGMNKNEDEEIIGKKGKSSSANAGKKKQGGKGKGNMKEPMKPKVDDDQLKKEQYAFISNYLYSLSNHLRFTLTRLQPVFNILLNTSLYHSKENIEYTIMKLWPLLKSGIATNTIKSLLHQFFKSNPLSKQFAYEFTELMHLQINNSDSLFTTAIDSDPSLLSKFSQKLNTMLNISDENIQSLLKCQELFKYFGFIIIKVLFYIILNDQINQDDTISAVENLILILQQLDNVNHKNVTILLISLLKTPYSNENLHKLLSIHLSKCSKEDTIMLIDSILDYDFLAKATMLRIVLEKDIDIMKQYQSLQYKLYVLLYEDNDVITEMACDLWNKFGLSLTDSFIDSEVFAMAFTEHREKDSINQAIRAYVHLKPHSHMKILSQYKTFYETEVDEQRDQSDEVLPKRFILLDFINETLELMSNDIKKSLLDYLMEVSDKEYRKEIFSKTNGTIFNIIHSITEKNVIDTILQSIEAQLKGIQTRHVDEINYNNLRIILMMLNSILVSTLHDTQFNERKEKLFESLIDMGRKIADREMLYLIYKNIEYMSLDIRRKSEGMFNEILAILKGTNDKSMINHGDVYVLAGLIKCFGISSYKSKQVDLIILGNMEKKKSNEAKINALYMITILFETLKKLYEPYFVQIFTQICDLIADRENKVREKAQECLKGMMKEISGYGVNQIMPSLIKDLHIINWKSKVANIEILGQFAFCAPKQLTIYIPKVIKEIMQVLKDPHPKVQETAVSVLQDIASAIRNPEIVEISPILINAIANPFENSNNALDALLETEFKHYLDPPSLALIIPIIDYNLKSQNDQLKRMSSHVIGSIQMLVSNPNDLIQYIDIIVPNLKNALFDSNPACRNSIAKSIGALTKSLGKAYLEDMLKWIVTYLEKDSETVQRSGAAQAYAEVIVSFGDNYIDKYLIQVIQRIQEGDSVVKEGYLSIFVFLPGCLGEKFEKYFELIFPLIIEAFSDESESVRNVSNKIFEICIKLFAKKNTKQLLDPLLLRLYDSNWRIRNSSIALVKTLIMNLNKEFFKEQSDYFQKEQRDQILVMTFILKSDQCGNTGTIANMIWRDYVDNIPKYLSKILKQIYEQLMELLSLQQDETFEVAECSVKLLASKFSDKFFMELLPIIRETLLEKKDKESIVDASVYILIIAVMEISEKLLNSFKDKILKIINECLFTPFTSVRKQIARIIYEMSRKLNDHHLNRNLIYNVMKQARGKPCEEQKKLLEIVAALVEISKGEVINYAIGEIFRRPYEEGFLELGTMISDQIAVYYNETVEIKNLYGNLYEAFFEFPAHAMTTIVAITEKLDEASLPIFIDFIEKVQVKLETKANDELNHAASKTSIDYYFSEILVTFCTMTQQNIIGVFAQLVERATLMLYFANEEITKNVGMILKALVEKTEKSPDVDIVVKAFINSLENVNRKFAIHHNEEETIDRLFTNKFRLMIENILYVIQNGLLYGDQKELSCDLINDLITFSDKATLKPFIMKIIGPIIRILSEKISPLVKEKLMDNAKTLIMKSKEDIKGISPQLQSVFLKTLTDSSSSSLSSTTTGTSGGITNCERFQYKAGENIVRLLQYYPRADVTANDLLKSISNKIDNHLNINAMFEMEILSDVIRFYGNILKPATLTTHFNTIESWLSTHPEIGYDSIIVLLTSYTLFLPNKINEIKLKEESHQRLFNFIALFNGDTVDALLKQKDSVLTMMKQLKKDDAMILLKPLGKIISKYRSYREYDEEKIGKMLKAYEDIVAMIMMKTDLLVPSKELPDANLCLFLLSLGDMKAYEEITLKRKVFKFVLKLIENAKLNLQLLMSCLSLIVLKEIKMTPDRDEIVDKMEEITDDEKEVDIVDTFLKKVYYLNN